MRTPILDFVLEYTARNPLRLHMPGHKGRGSAERLDITEIGGAGELYPARGIVRESEENAAALFGSAGTFYSTEGSSLCIRAMMFLLRLYAEEQGKAPLVLAGRNAHKTFLSAAAAMDLDVRWLYGESLLTCCPRAEEVAEKLDAPGEKPAAVYLTSPDYTGFRADIAGISAVCRKRNIPLLVDNAHGAYLRFLREGDADGHPLTLGADLVCDSAHKTLPVLTGGAWLHVGRNAPKVFSEAAERALAFFASTSPSWLILQSLDRCNALLAGDYPERIRKCAERLGLMREHLAEAGYETAPGAGDPLKMTLMPGNRGYTGDELHDLLRAENMECEFSDPDFLVMMITPEIRKRELKRLEDVLSDVPLREPRREGPPPLPRPERVMSLRAAALSPAEAVSPEECEGRILSEARVSCPPAVAPAVGGERIDHAALACFRYYGIKEKLICCRE